MTQPMGRKGDIFNALAALAMCSVIYYAGSPAYQTADMGLCLPSPNMWGLSHEVSWIIYVILLSGTAVALSLINKSFSVVPGSGTMLPGFFMLTATSIPWVTGSLTSSCIMAPACLACLGILFNNYRSGNAAQGIFLIATILSLGSMIQYGFLFMAVPILIIAAMFKCLHLREAFAFLMGLAAPYWIVLGLGLIPLDALVFPQLSNIWQSSLSHEMMFTGLLNIGFTAVVSLLLGLNNAMKLFAGNLRHQTFNAAVIVMEFCSVAMMVLDYNNLTAYIVTFYMCAAFQFANLFALWKIRKPWIPALIICAIYLTFFIIAVL